MDIRMQWRMLTGLLWLAVSMCSQAARAQTIYPDPPLPAAMVDWETAAQPDQDAAPSSNFIRAQALMGELAVAAYDSEASFRDQAQTLGFHAIDMLEGGFGSLAYIGAMPQYGMMFIAIRGSQEPEDFLADALWVETAVTDDRIFGEMHAGFLLHADEISEELPTVAPGCAGPLAGYQIWLTGHSLGGAAATLLAEILKQQGCDIAGVSTFGSPRPGLANFAASYTSSVAAKSHNWRYAQDPVYCMPPGGGWRHIGTHNRINPDGSATLNLNGPGCDDPVDLLWVLQDSLVGRLTLGQLAAHVGTRVAQAILDWLAGLFDLGIECVDSSAWDEVAFAGCNITDYGYNVFSNYGIAPRDLLKTLVTLALHSGDHTSYEDALDADFSVSANTRTIRFTIPNDSSLDDLTMYEHENQGHCTPTREGTIRYCDFVGALGSVIRVTVSGAPDLVAEPTDCTAGYALNPLRCDVHVDGAHTIPFFSIAE